jgi:hypothetical protein
MQQILQQLLANHEKAEASRNADLENLKRMVEEILRANQDDLKEMTACQEATETEPNPGMMQSIEKHQEIPKEDIAVMLVGEPRKQCRVCNLAAECRQKRECIPLLKAVHDKQTNITLFTTEEGASGFLI